MNLIENNMEYIADLNIIEIYYKILHDNLKTKFGILWKK